MQNGPHNLGGGLEAQVEAAWTMYTNESWCASGANAATILVSPDKKSMSHTTRLEFPTTNNASEYETLLLGLRKAKALGPRASSSKATLASWQATSTTYSLQGIPKWPSTWPRSGPWPSTSSASQSKPYCKVVTKPPTNLLKCPAQCSPHQQTYSTKYSMRLRPGLKHKGLRLEQEKVLSVKEVDWRTGIFTYLTIEEEPEDPSEAKHLRQHARNYSFVDKLLYKGGRMFPTPRVHIVKRRPSPPPRNPPGDLWRASGTLRPRGEGPPPRLLLAHGFAGHA